MTPPLLDADGGDLERFRGAIVRRLGLQFDDSKTAFLAEVLQRRLDAVGRGAARYLDELERGASSGEVGALAAELTVPETYFFRNRAHFDALSEAVLTASARPSRVLSAGCASGEEPYSLAIVLQERFGDGAPRVRAVDLNPAVLEKARLARYTPWALRATPEPLQTRWFEPAGRLFKLDESVRRAVVFEEKNIASPDPDLWRPEAYDVVFCRNVLMYFAPEVARAVVQRITRALVPGGYLFLGHAETLRGLSRDYALCHTHGTFYYRRRDELGDETRRSGAPRVAAAESASALDDAESWIDVIQRAHGRIEALARRGPSASGDRPRPVPAATSMQLALDLLRQERFADALELIGALPADSARDPDALLLEAALLTHAGRFGDAERVCASLLEKDALSAGAYYLLALCSEGTGDGTRAVEQDRVAAYLDAGFAMPRLHMGLLARRAGHRDLARRELSMALTLLEREDGSRLLLFGGGFGRDALVQLCSAELAACGGAP